MTTIHPTRRRLLASAGALAMAAALPATTFAQEPRRGGTITVHMPQEQRILNPALRASTGV